MISTRKLHEQKTGTMSLIKELLFESRADFAAKSFEQGLITQAKKDTSYKGELKADDIVKALEQADPNGTNIVFIAKQYSNGQFKIEDTERLKSQLEIFLKKRAKLKNKDLLSYKSLNDLYDALDLVKDVEVEPSQAQLAKAIKNDGSEKLIDTPNFKAIHVKTQEAACFYGKGTMWCTAADNNNRFDSYKNDLIVLLVKLDGKDRKFQFHYETDSFMNERDQSLSMTEIKDLSKLPEYKDFLNMLIKKHYEPFINAK